MDIRQYINQALPSGTIPWHEEGWRNYMFNNEDYITGCFVRNQIDGADDSGWPTTFREDTITQRQSADVYMKAHWPVWPPDLFGVTSDILDSTGLYLQIRPSNHNPYRALPSGERISAIAPWVQQQQHFVARDPFGLQHSHQTLLRLAGALWAAGAVTLSGLTVARPPGEPHPRGQQLKRHLFDGLITSAEAAVRYLSENNTRDCHPGQLEDLITQINQQFWDAVDAAIANGTVANLTIDRVFASRAHADHDIRLTDSRSSVQYLIREFAGNEWRAKCGSDPGAGQDPVAGMIDRSPGNRTARMSILILWAIDFILFHWKYLLRHAPSSVTAPQPEPGDAAGDAGTDRWLPMSWQAAVIRLHVIADEASKGIGFSPLARPGRDGSGLAAGSAGAPQPAMGLPPTPVAGQSIRSMWNLHLFMDMVRQMERGRDLPSPRTVGICYNDSLGSILPKARTPQRGCTVRSLGHNLCMIPAKGRLRGRWARQRQPHSASTYNLLLVPYPYRIKSKHVSVTSSSVGSAASWGFFEVAPNWLYEAQGDEQGRDRRPRTAGERRAFHELVWQFLRSMVKDQADGTIDAIVLPEACLDWECFAYIARRLGREFDRPPAERDASFQSIKLLVCGISSLHPRWLDPPAAGSHLAGLLDEDLDDDGRDTGGRATVQGNFVATFTREAASPAWDLLHVRGKHHRWCMDRGQLKSYSLSHRLSPDRLWWEGIDLLPREMLFVEFTAGSVLSTLVCEDLARIDPCQVALRAVGPNLILVLLMDAAQVPTRWSFQYAGVLSDDPGSSVLTLTSYALIERSSFSEGHTSRSVAIWREPGGSPRSIELPVGYHAMLVTLGRESRSERTLDGRSDTGDTAAVWQLAGVTPIRSEHCPPGGDPDRRYPPPPEVPVMSGAALPAEG